MLLLYNMIYRYLIMIRKYFRKKREMLKKKNKARRMLRVIFTFLIILAGPYMFLYFFINERGKDIFLNTLKEKYNIEASLDNLMFSFPLKVSLVDFKTKGVYLPLGSVDLGFMNPLSKSFRISKIYIKGLKVKLDKEIITHYALESKPNISNPSVTSGIPPKALDKEEVKTIVQGMSGDIFVRINTIILEDISIILSDNSLNPPLEAEIEGLSGRIRKVSYPVLSKLFVDISGALRVNELKTGKSLSVSGWVDWLNKDMDITLQAKNINYFIFKDYYPRFWKPKNLELKQADITINSRLVSDNDDLIMDYYLIVEKIVFNDKPENEAGVRSLKTILALFKKDGVPTAHFKYKTKMSAPMFKVDSIGDGLHEQLKELDKFSIFDAIEKIFTKGQDGAESGAKGIKGITIDPVFEGVKEAGEEFLKNIKSIFGRDKNGKDNE